MIWYYVIRVTIIIHGGYKWQSHMITVTMNNNNQKQWEGPTPSAAAATARRWTSRQGRCALKVDPALASSSLWLLRSLMVSTPTHLIMGSTNILINYAEINYWNQHWTILRLTLINYAELFSWSRATFTLKKTMAPMVLGWSWDVAAKERMNFLPCVKRGWTICQGRKQP